MKETGMDEEELEQVEISEDEAEEAETEEEQPEEPEEGSEEGDDEAEGDPEEGEPEEDPDAMTVSLEEEEQESSVIRQLRQKNRELERELKETRGASKKEEPLGPRPTPKEFDYDDEKYTAALESWLEKKSKSDAAKREQEARDKELQDNWNQRYQAYSQAKEGFAPDFEDAEDVARGILNQQQQSIVVMASEQPEKVVYVLGKHPEKAAELAKITDPIMFTARLARLESKMKVSAPSKPKPERRVSGNPGGVSAGTSLKKLEEEAARTGDYTKVIRAKRRARQKG